MGRLAQTLGLAEYGCCRFKKIPMTNPLACPSCSYERKATDAAPLTQCPSCHLVFAKYKPKNPAKADIVVRGKSTTSTTASSDPNAGQKVIALVFLVVILIYHMATQDKKETPTNSTDTAIKLLSDYGDGIVSSAESGVLSLQNVEKTTETPVRAYRVVFSTQATSLMAGKTGSTDRSTFLKNQGIALVWQTKFCTPELSNTMRLRGIGLISGQLKNADLPHQRDGERK